MEKGSALGSLDCVACTATTKTESTRWTAHTPTLPPPAAPNAHYGGLAQRPAPADRTPQSPLRWLAVGTSVPFSLWGCGGGSNERHRSHGHHDRHRYRHGNRLRQWDGNRHRNGHRHEHRYRHHHLQHHPQRDSRSLPGDGTSSSGGTVVNALLLSGIVRSDIRSSLTTSTTAAGRAADHPPQTRQHQCQLRQPGGLCGVPVALRPRRQLLDVQHRHHQRKTTCAACGWPTPMAR